MEINHIEDFPPSIFSSDDSITDIAGNHTLCIVMREGSIATVSLNGHGDRGV